MQTIRKSLISLGAALAGTKLVRAVSDVEVDDFLNIVGLSRRRSRVAQDLVMLGAGVLLGGGVALIFAPMSGRETRERLARKADKLGDAAATKLRDLRDEVNPRLSNAQSEARSS